MECYLDLLIQEIKGNSEKIVENYLSDKKYCLVANGVILDKNNVKLGVPQGLVLASLVFIIMVAVIGENMIISISQQFTDDANVRTKIRKKEDSPSSTRS